MKFPKTSEELKNEILISSDKSGDLRFRQLFRILPKVDSEVLVEGIIEVIEAEDRPNHFRDQEFVGKILETIKPKSQKDLEQILKRTLKNWDKSVEQFPFWLRDNYGLDKIEKIFANIDLTEEEKDKVNTMKWWLHLK